MLNEPTATGFYFPTIRKQVENDAELLAFDHGMLPLKRHLCLYYSKPHVIETPVLKPSGDHDAPDALGCHFYGTVLYDEGRYRMWYVGMSIGLNPDLPEEDLRAARGFGLDVIGQGPLCYAESADGLNWEKPALGQMSFRGSRENNALYFPDALIHCATVIKDEEDPDPARRYKMVYQYLLHHDHSRQTPTMRTATSADGLNWQVGPREVVCQFVEHSSFYKFNGLYIVNTHKTGEWSRGEGGSMGGRKGYALVSPDFDHWLEEIADSFALPEPQNPGERGRGRNYDQVHLGTGGRPYSTAVVGLYSIWHDNEDFGKISGDLGLVVSSDGLHFHEPYKGQVFLASTDSVSPYKADCGFPNVLEQANGILNCGDETRIYHGRWTNVGDLTAENVHTDYAEIALATLPRDRWVALGLCPDEKHGSVWSAPVCLPDDEWQLFLNADCASAMTVEIADPRFALLPQFSGRNSGRSEATGGFDCPVSWANSLSELGGREVRFRIVMDAPAGENPRLFAIYLRRKAA